MTRYAAALHRLARKLRSRRSVVESHAQDRAEDLRSARADLLRATRWGRSAAELGRAVHAREEILAALHATQEARLRIEARQRELAAAIGVAPGTADAARAALTHELFAAARSALHRPSEPPPLLH